MSGVLRDPIYRKETNMVSNTGNIDVTHTYDFAGMDDIVGNERTRAQKIAVTLTGTAALGSAYSTNSLGQNWINGFGPPRSGAGAAGATLLAADLLTGVITWTSTAASQTLTFDSAANIVNAVNQISAGAVVGDMIQCLIINGGATNSFTLTAGAGGGFDGNNANRTVGTSSSKYCYIRLNNVTGGSESYTIYF
jgi:hypothetical protein